MERWDCRSFIILVIFYTWTTNGQYYGPSDQPEAYFNGSSYVRLQTTISLKGQTGLSFRTCAGGELLSQQHNENIIELSIGPEGLKFFGKTAGKHFDAIIPGDYLNNEWHVVYIVYRLGNLTLSLDDKIVLLANGTYHVELLNSSGLYNEGAVLIIGKHYNGCILEGPSITFNKTIIQSHNVRFGTCPIQNDNCNLRQDIKIPRAYDFCLTGPCMMHGVCENEENTYSCICSPRYAGKNCEIDMGNPCDKNPPICKNGAACIDDPSGNYKCSCPPGYTGKHCETEIKLHPLCVPNPCLNGGNCQITKDENQVQCVCLPGFAGLKCETNINECQSNPCKNNGICLDGPNNYTCDCSHTGYTGYTCENDINECHSKPCMNRGICFNTYGSYMCECMNGFDGNKCEKKINECKSQPCMNHGKCEDKMGGFECHCIPGYGGHLCETELHKGLCDPNLCGPFADCKEISGVPTCTCKSEYGGMYPNCATTAISCANNPCLNGAVCSQWGSSYNCTCLPGFKGTACELHQVCNQDIVCLNGGTCIEELYTYGCMCTDGFTGHNCEKIKQCIDQPCQHVINCKDFHGGYYCNCEPGWTGLNCDVNINDCKNQPCLNGATCIDLLDNFKCQCPLGFSGERCHINIDDCAKQPCANGGTCTDAINAFICNCTDNWMGPTCESPFNACELRPCKHNSTCNVAVNMHDYSCSCTAGFEGTNCEVNINDCQGVTCAPGKICIDLIDDHACQCPPGYRGDTCTQDADPCIKSLCENGICVGDATGQNYTCECTSGYTGFYCEVDIDECQATGPLCNHGICVNQNGTFQCYCMPGYTGERCNLDFDECLSQPCRHNSTCLNKVNNYECACQPGYEGKDCHINIDECATNPCMEGSTCVDGINEFTCVCQAGLTGKQCEINIDDCMSSPCSNGAKCIDGLNMYTCDCTDTGYKGVHCEINIDDCIGNPCENGAPCIDEVKNYHCNCFNGYTGKNCEEDINECESNPCQNNGLCLEKSNITLYNTKIELPPTFTKPFDYLDASGYECVCVVGVMGQNCEININECDSSPCIYGTCVDKIGGYECECDEGFEGINCEVDIDECEKYHPCIHGTCHDKRANYYCDCEADFGGKNCSVELTGCKENPCQNRGTCKPYLDNEIFHKFNCTCPHGFHGHTCDKVTTMSLSGQSLVVANTSRDEGHDIQFRFKTTLGDGFLALGRGSTYYIMSLAKGRLNLHSSLLNKWDGVFVGASLNDSNWQRVFVAINSSHLVLSANDEQTIYPINNNYDNNGSANSFPTTYIGGYPNNHKKLTHGQPFLVGCIEDVIVNGEWVLPENPSWVGLHEIEVGCHRVPQCKPNPCHSGGHCTDLWSNFSCTCERPYLGHTCQYNYTAATFGNENISDSLVTVTVSEQARRAVRSIVDISMFIRTRQSGGQIFYLGSALSSGTLQNESYITAQLYEGELLVRIQFNGTLEHYTVGGVKLHNGYNHLIEVIRNVTLVQVKLNGTEYFRKTISATGTLDAQVLFLGGHPQIRSVRQTSSESTITKPEVTASTGPATVTTPLSTIHFKGIIQDVQVSDGSKTMVVEFFPLQAEELIIPMKFGNVSFDNSTVMPGVVSDKTCQINPCHHNGICKTTWNDYRCECPRGFKGKDCKELEFCELERCPGGSECKNLEDGYECVANATFDGEISPLLYNLTISPSSTKVFNVDSIEVTYRTRSWGTALFAKHESNYFIIFIYHDEVIIEWSLGGYMENKRFRKEHFDGQWVTLLLKFKDSVLKGGFKEHVIDDTPNFVVNDFNMSNFTEIFAKGIIYVAGSDNKTFDYSSVILNGDYNGSSYVTLTDTTTTDPIVSNSVDFMDTPFPSYKIDLNKNSDKFKGCLSEIRIGKLLLPYFTNKDLYPKSPSPEEFFELWPVAEHSIGCQLCYEKDCYNEGQCIDAFSTYKCECPAGFAADDCSIDINECEENQCQNNATCVDKIARYECECILGYDGKFCEHEIDECESGPCHHGGSCIDMLGTFRCECPEDYVGKQCEALRLITCENQPCKDGSTCANGKNELTQNNFTCNCAEGMLGILCDTPFCSIKTKSCENDGFCNTTSGKVPFCQCLLGFDGMYCENNIDDCKLASGNSPCQNGGICIDGINRYDCNCNGTGYSGLLCEMDIDECVSSRNLCGSNGSCSNIPGSYRCDCSNGLCGYMCSLRDPCETEPCLHGICESKCARLADYNCKCEPSWAGQNCTENELSASQSDDGLNILLIVIPIVIVILLGLGVALIVLVNVARSKRATRGTYSPSAQEFCNPRVELDHVLKPPPEERLI